MAAYEGNLDARVLPLSAVPRALVNCDTRGFVRIVAERESGRIIGATSVAGGPGEVIQAAVYAILFGLVEAFKLAGQTFTRDVAKLSCCAAYGRSDRSLGWRERALIRRCGREWIKGSRTGGGAVAGGVLPYSPFEIGLRPSEATQAGIARR